MGECELGGGLRRRRATGGLPGVQGAALCRQVTASRQLSGRYCQSTGGCIAVIEERPQVAMQDQAHLWSGSAQHNATSALPTACCPCHCSCHCSCNAPALLKATLPCCPPCPVATPALPQSLSCPASHLPYCHHYCPVFALVLPCQPLALLPPLLPCFCPCPAMPATCPSASSALQPPLPCPPPALPCCHPCPSATSALQPALPCPASHLPWTQAPRHCHPCHAMPPSHPALPCIATHMHRRLLDERVAAVRESPHAVLQKPQENNRTQRPPPALALGVQLWQAVH